MEKDAFAVLITLKSHPRLTQRAIAEECSISLGKSNAIVKKLKAEGLISESSEITDDGFDALAPYKVRNAVIMAAGLSSRFAPISYERPKGVLKVRGEILIERQINQLKEAGIDDITVVVGYKKEEFFYLEDKFDVRIVVNDDFATRNNNSTIKKVEDVLGNTYICSSDNYFTINPFEQYVYDTYYASVYHVGHANEYFLKTNHRNGVIVEVTVGGSDSWIMLGHAYWDRSFARKFTEILDRIYDEPETANKLWEDIYIEHVTELPMRIRKYPVDAIWEFDSIDELRSFDPYFIESVDSRILDNICATLNCERDQIKRFEPIKHGLTNLSMRFEVDNVPYVYRHPEAGTDEIINRESEAFSQGVTKNLGIDRTFVYEDPQTG